MNEKWRFFSDKQKLRELISKRPVLKEILKQIPQAERRWSQTNLDLHKEKNIYESG